MGRVVFNLIKRNTLFLFFYNYLSKVKGRYVSDRRFYENTYKSIFGRDLDINHPQRLTEKIQWLKLYDRKSFYVICADKYAARSYLSEKFGNSYLIPLLFETTNVDDIREDNIPNCHCILKPNHDSGHYVIIRDKKDVDFKELRNKCRDWLSHNYYTVSREWQYKNINPRRIIVEKLLETKEGKLPNDYKLHYFNGKLQFVYVSFDREGINDRCIYDKEWNRLPFVWVPQETYRETMNTADVPRPESFDKMVELGNSIAVDFKYVRVDFYDVDGKLYFGEITLYHGSGYDKFYPDHYDLEYGKRLNLEL